MKISISQRVTATMVALCMLSGCAVTNTCGTRYESMYVPSITIECDSSLVFIGGYGSDMEFHERDSTLWILTDRGPNVEGALPDSKLFPLPDFAPHIGVFRVEGDTLRKIRVIELKDSLNRTYNGLPYSQDSIPTEVAIGVDGSILKNEKYGLDPEGLAVMPDRTFWVSDEYGPYLIHFDSDGNFIESFSPHNGKLPTRYLSRRLNRGLEGLCSNRSGSLLYCMMQSPLVGDESGCVPLCVLEPATGLYREYYYRLESADNGVCGVYAVTDSTLLVLERDGLFHSNQCAAFKRVYRVELGSDTLLSKSEVLDILEVIPQYAHDKVEGITMIGDSILCVINDDDFGIAEDGKGGFASKIDALNGIDRNELFFIRL